MRVEAKPAPVVIKASCGNRLHQSPIADKMAFEKCRARSAPPAKAEKETPARDAHVKMRAMPSARQCLRATYRLPAPSNVNNNIKGARDARCWPCWPRAAALARRAGIIIVAQSARI